MKTKFGNAKINNTGYYVITSGKECNTGKLLHRLIWEDFYDCEVPEGYVIHHKNEDKLDNCILNLQLMRNKDHVILHHKNKTLSEETKMKISEYHKGKPLPEETKKKISESHKGKNHTEETKIKLSDAKNTSGYFRVYKQNCKKCNQGFTWAYRYYENGKRKTINCVSIEKLEAKVKAKGLKWREI